MIDQTAQPHGQPDGEPPGDDAAMALVAARDHAAFRALVERHARAVHALAWRLTGDNAAAEDIAQEAMLRLWDHADRWRPGGPGVGAWLRRVTTNLAFDRARRSRFVVDADLPDHADDAPTAEEVIDSDAMKRAARLAVMALPARQRAAIVLTYFEELPNAQAADAMEMNIKAFESLLLRARSALRQHIGGVGDTLLDRGP